eukprot:gb/GEZN01001789.1/.p1 GENE.gb/GEZN01001789.1/~~gb/GEZN01001789.1/.p1  ORF type:complete len:843 (+),score=163.23 gb/GEZN01001789.1/:194-2530(+)
MLVGAAGWMATQATNLFHHDVTPFSAPISTPVFALTPPNEAFWQTLDVNKDGKLSFTEMDKAFTLAFPHPEMNADTSALQAAFSATDLDHSQWLSRQEFVGLLSTLSSSTPRKPNVLSFASTSDGPFVPKAGVDDVVVKPVLPQDKPILLQAVPPALVKAHCLFYYGEGQVPTELADGKESEQEGWIYGAKLDGALAVPTGMQGDVLKGQLLCFSALSFSAKLKLADGLNKFNADKPDEGSVRRGTVKVVDKQGGTHDAYWYFQGKIGEANADTQFKVVRIVHGKQAGTSADIHCNGATVTSWLSKGHEMLFLTKKAITTQLGKAIRGGIPLVFPQFGPGPIQQHGFARNVLWASDDKMTQDAATGDVTTTFTLVPNDYSTAMWPYQFKLVYSVTLKADSLVSKLLVQNTDSKPFSFTTLLHTYFKVPSIHDVRIRGLKDAIYIDKTRAGVMRKEESPIIKITEETDRIYQNVPESNEIVVACGTEGSAPYFLTLKRSGFTDVVLWNPWIEGAKALAKGDFLEEEYQQFMAVEAGLVSQAVELNAGETWEGSQEVVLQGLSAASSSGSKQRKVALFGSTGGTGMATLRQLLDIGDFVTCLVRSPEKLPADLKEHPNIKLVVGDALDAKAVRETVVGAEAVVVSLGGNSTNQICSAAQVVINAAVNAECPDARMVVVTSMGTGSSYQYCNMMTKAVVNTVLRKAIADKVIQEEAVQASIKSYVLVRPGGLTTKPGLGKWNADEKVPGGTIPREDVAAFIIKEALGTDKWVNQGVTVCSP